LINKRNLSYDPEQQTTLEELALSRDVNLVLNEQSSSLIDFIESSTEKSKITTISTTKKEKRSRRR
ncbi:MAG: mobilization protein, partial [Crocosphaera sp.]